MSDKEIRLMLDYPVGGKFYIFAGNNNRTMKKLNEIRYDYESPLIQIIDIQSESMLCWSSMEGLEETEGDWGW